MTEVRLKDEAHNLDWAYGSPSLETKRLETYLGDIPGYDREKVLKGQIIDRIIKDDGNSFMGAALSLGPKVHRPELAQTEETSFGRRMQWELDQPLTPAKIKEAIERTREQIKGITWDSRENVSKARKIWEENVLQMAQQMVDTNEEGAKDAWEEFRRFYYEISKKGLAH